jgi:hypothetical protein
MTGLPQSIASERFSFLPGKRGSGKYFFFGNEGKFSPEEKECPVPAPLYCTGAQEHG